MKGYHYVVPLLVAAFGCTKADTGPTATDEPALDPAPPDGGQQLASATYMLAPGEERYECYQFYAPDAQVAITHVQAIEPTGVHHLALFQAYGRDEAPATPHECNVLIRETWMPIFVTGAGAKEMTMPNNSGLVIDSGTQYILQLHLQNTGDSPLAVRAGVNLAYDRDVTQVVPAGIFALGKQNFTVPASTPDFQIPVSCAANKDMNVFAAFPHMHKIGKALSITKATGTDAPTDLYRIDPWVFGEQPIDMITQHVTTGDHLALTCHFDNPTGADVTYGESSDNEMCYFVMYYYPYDHLDGCIDG